MFLAGVGYPGTVMRRTPDALAAYEHLRRDRTERIVQTGTHSGTNPVPPTPGTRMQGPPSWIFDHHIDWQATVTVPSEPEAAPMTL